MHPINKQQLHELTMFILDKSLINSEGKSVQGLTDEVIRKYTEIKDKLKSHFTITG